MDSTINTQEQADQEIGIQEGQVDKQLEEQGDKQLEGQMEQQLEEQVQAKRQ